MKYTALEKMEKDNLHHVIDLICLVEQGHTEATIQLRDLLEQGNGWPATMGDTWEARTEAYDLMTRGQKDMFDARVSVATEAHPIPAQVSAEKTVSKLAAMRIKRGMSQGDLAKATGINKQMISRIERGERLMKNTTLETCIKLADALGVTDLRELVRC